MAYKLEQFSSLLLLDELFASRSSLGIPKTELPKAHIDIMDAKGVEKAFYYTGASFGDNDEIVGWLYSSSQNPGITVQITND